MIGFGLSFSDDQEIIKKYSYPEFPEIISKKTIDIEKEIFNRINELREMSGLKLLKKNIQLDEIARAHSIDMIENDFFSHTNLFGQTPTDRAKARGFKVKRSLRDRTYITEISENIGKMPTGLVLYRGHVEDKPEAIAEALIKSWMARPGHRANILRFYSIKTGIGVAFDGKYYVATQLFH
ncbi:MAG: CAP domain-containing protein [Acidobacteriota bacterium]